MNETKKAAHGEQPDALTSNSIIPQRLTVENAEMIPVELKNYDKWILWRLEDRKGKLTKVPYTTNGKMASSTDERTWTSFETAVDTYKRSNGYYSGIGYVFTKDDPFTGVDLDDCIDDESGQLTDEARRIITELKSYTEFSQSKTGVHVIIQGQIPGKRNRTGKYEMYEKERFFCVTGNHLSSTPATIEFRQLELNSLYSRLFKKPDPATKERTVPAGQRNSELSDQDVMSIALKAKNGGNFATLYGGDASGYSSQSEADLALCNMLAFYTKDAIQIERLMRGSGLMREKWDRDDYVQRTIEKALEGVTEHYKARSGPNNVVRLPVAGVSNPEGSATRERAPRFNNTDLGNAKRLAHYFGDDLRYCYKFGSWYIWDNKKWSRDETGAIERKAKDTVMQIYKEALQEEDEKRTSLMKHAVSSESRQKISNMISLAQSEETIPVRPDELDKNQWKLNCSNGTIDLKTGKLLSHNREDLITKMVPTAYDPDADCPRWKAFLNQIMQDEEGNVRHTLVRFLQKAIGYSLTGSIREQVMFILHGGGANGKGTFINTMKSVLGDYAMQSSTETFLEKKAGGINNDVAGLKGARLVVASESGHGKKLAESLVKQLTGEDMISARFLHQEYFEFMPTFKIWFVTNHKPDIRGNDDGIWRRIRLIPFSVTIPTEDRVLGFAEQLADEYPGILKWAVDGCMMWQQEGLGVPEEVMDAVAAYRNEMDTLASFVEEYCVISPDARVSSKELYKVYQDWCDETGEYKLSINKFATKFRERMEANGIQIKEFRTSKMRGYEGIGLAHNYFDDTMTQGDTRNTFNNGSNYLNRNSKNGVMSVTVSQTAAGKGYEEGEI